MTTFKEKILDVDSYIGSSIFDHFYTKVQTMTNLGHLEWSKTPMDFEDRLPVRPEKSYSSVVNKKLTLIFCRYWLEDYQDKWKRYNPDLTYLHDIKLFYPVQDDLYSCLKTPDSLGFYLKINGFGRDIFSCVEKQFKFNKEIARDTRLGRASQSLSESRPSGYAVFDSPERLIGQMDFDLDT